MQPKKLILRIIAILGLGLAPTPASAAAPENVALGKVCTASLPPDARICTDPDDLKQLTDGLYTSGNFWTQKTTVGWENGKHLVIKVDLGNVEPLAGAAFSTAAGGGRSWPSAIYVLVSDDGKIFHEAGELINLNTNCSWPVVSGIAAHKFATQKLNTRGRYVDFVVLSGNPVFVDEIELYRGDPGLLTTPVKGEFVDDENAFIEQRVVCAGVSRRLRTDAQDIRLSLTNSWVPAALRDQVMKDLARQETEIPNLPQRYDDRFRAVLPLNGLHARIFQAQAKLWSALTGDRISIWQSGLWDPLQPVRADIPSSRPVLDVVVMKNEFRAAAFNLSNAGSEDQTIRMKIVGLPGGTNPRWITVHEVVWTDTRSGKAIASALPVARQEKGTYLLGANAGLTRQVWLTFNPVAIRAGTHTGRIVLSGKTTREELPVTIRVFPMRMPDRLALHVGGWDYTDTEDHLDVTPTNRSGLIDHLRRHFVDSPWATAAVMPFAAYDLQGHKVADPDTLKFDVWLRRWPRAERYCVFNNVGDDCAGAKIGTPEFASRVRDWALFWARHARSRGIKPEQLALLLVDEPSDSAKDARALAWARAVHAAATGMKIWEDPYHADPFAANQDMLAACDVLCPNRAKMVANPNLRSFYTEHRSKGPELAFYSCSGPAKLLDPYTYFRLQAWDAWRTGAKSSYFWAFSDSGGCSSWNEYIVKLSNYCPLFLDEASVTSAKHMEAIRESAEDYQYLVMLQQALELAAKRGVTGPNVDRAKQLLSGAAKTVCSSEGASNLVWSVEKDRTVADQVRLEILESLLALNTGRR